MLLGQIGEVEGEGRLVAHPAVDYHVPLPEDALAVLIEDIHVQGVRGCEAVEGEGDGLARRDRPGVDDGRSCGGAGGRRRLDPEPARGAAPAQAPGHGGEPHPDLEPVPLWQIRARILGGTAGLLGGTEWDLSFSRRARWTQGTSRTWPFRWSG